MKQETKDKIEEAVNELESVGGSKNPDVKKVIDKIRKALKSDKKPKE